MTANDVRMSDGGSDVCSSDRAAVWEFSFQRFPKPAIEIIGESCYSPGMGSSVPHDFAVSIERADIDYMGHVNNASYLKWVQAAVLSHWRRIAPPDAVDRKSTRLTSSH